MVTKPSRAYTRKFHDSRWQRVRLKVLEAANYLCQCCGEKDNRELHIHHTYYEYGKEPWDYPIESLKALCSDCHAYYERARQWGKQAGRAMSADPQLAEFVMGCIAAFALEEVDDDCEVVECLRSPESVRAISAIWSMSSPRKERELEGVISVGKLTLRAVLEIGGISPSDAYNAGREAERKK